jgi:dTDP-4-amino-4,6-dideoxygalactose transaminase
MTDTPWRIALADVVIGDEERRAILEVLDSGWLSMGPRTEAFEAELARFLDAEHVLAVTNGTAALHLAAAALGLGPGDEVIVPALTFVASAAGIRQTGATVRLADSTSLDDFAIDPAELERLAGPQTKAVVVLHYGGHPANMQAIEAIARERGLLVIEDAAHALGGSLDGRACGTLGEAGCFSFFPNKNMTTGEGGAVVVRDAEAAARARRLRSHAMTTLTWDRHRGHASTYDVVDLGFNYRIDEMRAALGSAQLARLPHLNEQRAALSARYRERLAASTRVSVPTQGSRGESAHHIAVAVVESEELRDAIREELREQRIQTSVHYPAISRFSAYAGGDAQVPTAEAIAARAVTLPLHPKLTVEDVDTVCDALLAATGER